eukprot:8639797-Prorocentrum_lima.AAC.1
MTEGDASVMKGCKFAHSATKSLENDEDECYWHGSWLIRHHRRPRRMAYHPDWKSCELIQFELGNTFQ